MHKSKATYAIELKGNPYEAPYCTPAYVRVCRIDREKRGVEFYRRENSENSGLLRNDWVEDGEIQS